ncbi:Ribokinase-like protein [Lipomyces japonicus]|uniref:Ribokinase-like protein n=1 Tax=Lipomyces japonicus TaxID=56871 RepID=UPI0034CF8BD8
MPHVTILGSLNYDLVTFTSKVPLGGETILSDSFATHCGGKGANQALAVRRLSSPDTVEVRMVGRVGKDAFGVELKDGLENAGVDVSLVEEIEGKSGVAVIIVERSGENRILVSAGANGTFVPDDITSNLFMTDKGKLTDYLVLQNELPLPVIYRAIELGHAKGVNIVYNPSPMDSSVLTSGIIKKISYLIVNETELSQLIGVEISNEDIQDHERLIKKIRTLYDKFLFSRTVIVTLGGKGVIAFTNKGESFYIQAFEAEKVVDTTGAGDSFLGAFVGAVADGKNVKVAIERGAAAGAIAVSREGAADSIPFLEETRELLKK